MALIDNYQVVVAPVQQGKVYAIADSVISRQVGMEKHIVTQTIFIQGVVLVVTLISLPVRIKFLGTEHEHTLIAILVILNHAQGRESLS